MATAGFEDRRLVVGWVMDRVAAFDVVEHLVLGADVRERPTHHYLVVPASGAVGVEFVGFDAVQWTGSVTYSQISSDDASMTISALAVAYMD